MYRHPRAELPAALLFTLLASTSALAQTTTTLEEISVVGVGGNGSRPAQAPLGSIPLCSPRA